MVLIREIESGKLHSVAESIEDFRSIVSEIPEVDHRLFRVFVGTQSLGDIYDVVHMPVADLEKVFDSVCDDPVVTETESPDEEAISVAREMYGYGGVVKQEDIRIDWDAEVSHADDGVWVQAWVWVPKKEIADEP